MSQESVKADVPKLHKILENTQEYTLAYKETEYSYKGHALYSMT